MTTVDVLKSARSSIVKGWLRKGPLAVDTNGVPVAPQSSEAVAWDLMGSVYAASHNLPEGGPRSLVHREAMEALRMQVPHLKAQQLSVFNDASGRTKEEIIEIFDRAISTASDPEGMQRISEAAEEQYERFKRETGRE